MPLRIDKGLLRAVWDFFVLFSGISTASNLSRTQRQPVRRRGLFLYRPEPPAKPNDPPGHEPPPSGPLLPSGPEPESQQELAGNKLAVDLVVRLAVQLNSSPGDLQIFARRTAADPQASVAPMEGNDQSLPSRSVFPGTFRSEIRSSVHPASSSPQRPVPAPSFRLGPREAAASNGKWPQGAVEFQI
jgi:hypothetical protein